MVLMKLGELKCVPAVDRILTEPLRGGESALTPALCCALDASQYYSLLAGLLNAGR